MATVVSGIIGASFTGVIVIYTCAYAQSLLTSQTLYSKLSSPLKFNVGE